MVSDLSGVDVKRIYIDEHILGYTNIRAIVVYL